jgi:ubiquitin carboxyl-terminal hydrolase 4/11/15
MHEDLNKIKQKPQTPDVESDGRPDEVVSQISWDNYRSRNDSLLSDIMTGQYRSEIRCPDCPRVSVTFDPFLSLTLQFPKPEKANKVEGYFLSSKGELKKVSV